MPLSKVETKTQEIILWLSIAGSFALLLGGVFYISLSHESLISFTGSLGTSILGSLFTTVGYSAFLLGASIFLLGQYLIKRTTHIRDLARYYPKVLLQLVFQISFVILVASFFRVFESYLNIDTQSVKLAYGSGGILGTVVGGNLFSLFGLLGALTMLTSMIIVTGIISGRLELVNMSLLIIETIKASTSQGVRLGVHVSKRSAAGISTHAITLLKKNSTTAKICKKTGLDSVSVDLPDSSDNFIREDMDNNTASGTLLKVSGEAPEGLEINPAVNKKTQLVSLKRITLDDETDSREEETSKKSETAESKKPTTKKRSRKAKDKNEEEAKATSEDTKNNETDEKNDDEILVKSWKSRYKKPDSALLQKPLKAKGMTKEELKKSCENLQERLASFQITGKVVYAHRGPSLTMYEFLPDAGVKLSKISGLTNDLALVLGASSIRILAPIPGKTTVGIEVPNKEPNMVTFSELLPAVQKATTKSALPIAMGKDVYNNVIVEDIAKMPHLLISGTTGSGKSVFINSLITSLLYTKSPKELRFLMVDPKMIELSPYNGIPHLLKPVVTDVEEAKDVLVWAEKEMDRRYEMFAQSQSRNIDSFNNSIRKGSKASLERRLGKKVDWEWAEMPYIVVVVDELADLMITQGKEVEIPITRIAQKARSAGIHLVIATQRPSAEIVTGLIKTNFPTRIAFKVSSSVDSRTILDSSGAERLLGNGDSLFMPNGKALERLQGSFISEDEVKKLVNEVKENKPPKK